MAEPRPMVMADKGERNVPARSDSEYFTDTKKHNIEFHVCIVSMKLERKRVGNSFGCLLLPAHVKILFGYLLLLFMLVRYPDIHEDDDAIYKVLVKQLVDWEDFSAHLVKFSNLSYFKDAVIEIIKKKKSDIRSAFLSDSWSFAVDWQCTVDGITFAKAVKNRGDKKISEIPLPQSFSDVAHSQETIEKTFGKSLQMAQLSELYDDKGKLLKAKDSVLVGYVLFQSYNIQYYHVLGLTNKIIESFTEEELDDMAVGDMKEKCGTTMKKYRSISESKTFWSKLADESKEKNEKHTQAERILITPYYAQHPQAFAHLRATQPLYD